MSNGNIDPFDLPSVIRTLESATSRPDGLPPLLHFLEGLCQLLQEDLPAEITADLHSWVAMSSLDERVYLRIRSCV